MCAFYMINVEYNYRCIDIALSRMKMYKSGTSLFFTDESIHRGLLTSKNPLDDVTLTSSLGKWLSNHLPFNCLQVIHILAPNFHTWMRNQLAASLSFSRSNSLSIELGIYHLQWSIASTKIVNSLNSIGVSSTVSINLDFKWRDIYMISILIYKTARIRLRKRRWRWI